MQNGPTNVQTPAPAPSAPPSATDAKAGWLVKLQAHPALLRKLLMLAILVGVGVGSFCWGRRQQQVGAESTDPSDLLKKASKGDYGNRVVAYLYNKEIKVSREELGEYLIDRFGSDRLEFMLNRKIVEMECAKVNISATNAEVEERFQKDLRSFGTQITEKEFVNSILRRFGKTLYEWKEDVIRPKIMMEKLVRSSVKITDKDLHEGFEARYGPRVECRMIVCEKGNARVAQQVWEDARKGRAFFLEAARKQFIPNLAQEEGRVPPIHKHFGDKDLEEAAFRLKDGEVSNLMTMADGSYVILLCEKHLPANITMRFDEVRTQLYQEMFELRVAQRIPEEFARMRQRANPYVVLDNTGQPSATVLSPTSALQGAGPQFSGPPPVPVVVPAAPKPGPIDASALPAPPTTPATPTGPAITVPMPTPLAPVSIPAPEKK